MEEMKQRREANKGYVTKQVPSVGDQSWGTQGSTVECTVELSQWRYNKAGAFIHQSLVCQLLEGCLCGYELLWTSSLPCTLALPVPKATGCKLQGMP